MVGAFGYMTQPVRAAARRMRRRRGAVEKWEGMKVERRANIGIQRS
jgi:hypothetical protein